MRHPLLISLAVGVVAFVAANSAESALIAATGGNPWPVVWTSETLLSCALVVATYLWLHVRSLQGALSSFERARIELEKELRLAAAIQRHLLKSPETFRTSLSWHAVLQRARRVGGDFYDVLPLPDGSVLVVTADISGKGIPAAIALASVLSFPEAAVSEGAAVKAARTAPDRRRSWITAGVAADLSRIVLFYTNTLWLGLLTLGGLSIKANGVFGAFSVKQRPPGRGERDGRTVGQAHRDRGHGLETGRGQSRAPASFCGTLWRPVPRDRLGGPSP